MSLQDSLELVFKQSKAVAVTSMAFPLGDVNNFIVGSEDGSVYSACRHGRSVPLRFCVHSKCFEFDKTPGNICEGRRQGSALITDVLGVLQ